MLIGAQLAVDPGAALADMATLPAALPALSASLQSADSEVGVVVSTKLEGELAAQFQKVGYGRLGGV